MATAKSRSIYLPGFRKNSANSTLMQISAKITTKATREPRYTPPNNATINKTALPIEVKRAQGTADRYLTLVSRTKIR